MTKVKEATLLDESDKAKALKEALAECRAIAFHTLLAALDPKVMIDKAARAELKDTHERAKSNLVG